MNKGDAVPGPGNGGVQCLLGARQRARARVGSGNLSSSSRATVVSLRLSFKHAKEGPKATGSSDVSRKAGNDIYLWKIPLIPPRWQ